MSTELNVIPSSALTEQEQADLNASIDSIIAAHKNDRQEINRLVFESVSAMTDSEGYEQELSSRKGLRRFWGAITGSNKRLQDKINSSRAAAQFAAQTTLQRFSEQNLLTFDLITAVNNKLNASMTAVEGEINQIYAALIQFFKQNRSDMIQLENRVANLEQNVNLLNWQNSIEYQMLDGVEYVDLDDASKIVCMVRDFYDITGGEWRTSDLLLLKTVMSTIDISPRGNKEEDKPMTADTLKTTRVLELYQAFLSGKLINKQEAAGQYHVNARSIQRDIDSIRDFLAEQCAKEGIVRRIEYDKKENGYRLVTQEIERLSKGEVLALCKILLESRAFTREQVEKQLQIILNLCVSQKEKAEVEWFISNELFNYHDPAHAAVDPDNLWMAAQAIRNQSVLEIEYQKLKDHQIVKRTVEPVGLMFSEYYFYLMGIITDSSTREAFHKKNDPYSTIYRLDRIHSVRETGEKFSVPYKERFKEGEYKNRTQFMFGGEPQTIRFNYYGPSVEAVLDKFPMAKVVDKQDGVCSIEAEVFGTGVKMWLLSQGSRVKVTAPETLVQEMKQEIEKMDDWY